MNEKQVNVNEITAENGEVEIDLPDLVKYILQHWITLVIFAVAGLVAAFLITALVITPQYQAQSSIYVVSATANSAFDLSDLNFGSSLTNDYKELVTSRTMLENVIADTGEDLTVRQLRSMLSVGNETGTRILKFTLTSSDPVQAMRLANSFKDQAIIFLPEVMGVKDNVPTEVDDAILPTTPSNIRYTRNMAIGLLIGLVIIVAIHVVRYMMNDAINSAEDLERYLGVMPMAVVPENGQKHRGGGGYYYYTNQGKRGA